MSRTTHIETIRETTSEPHWWPLVRQSVASLRYGVVQIVVHDSQVTQIEITERVRLERSRPDSH